MPVRRLLLIEDENLLGQMLVDGLQAAHYEVEWFQNGADGFKNACENDYAVVLLDLMVPGMDGWTICRRLRDRRDTTPILMLTARDEVEDRVRGLEIGADDYLSKPFAFAELKARIAALLRRERTQRRRVLRIADLSIDTDAREVTRSGKMVALTSREFDLLTALAGREGHAVSKEAILTLWGDTESLPNTVEVHLAALRRKLDGDRPAHKKLIHTVYGFGYVLREPTEEETCP
ncbi:MAG: response regulator transcription factor [Akkermansiaceae bacterium]|nr:response regulator transcription factor [Armatimonadota bacterium]